MMNKFCKTCLKKDACKRICKELEEHLKNDIEVKQKEILIPEITEDSQKIDYVSNYYLTPRESEIVTLLGRGLTRQQIRQVLDISPENLRTVLKKLKKKSIE